MVKFDNLFVLVGFPQNIVWGKDWEVFGYIWGVVPWDRSGGFGRIREGGKVNVRVPCDIAVLGHKGLILDGHPEKDTEHLPELSPW